ncbi:MAG: hypothetical protein RL240_3053 [Planctomycetota bacterium]
MQDSRSNQQRDLLPPLPTTSGVDSFLPNFYRLGFESLNALLLSLCIHLAIMLSLAFFLIGGDGRQRGGIELWAESSSAQEDQRLDVLEISSTSIEVAPESVEEEATKSITELNSDRKVENATRDALNLAAILATSSQERSDDVAQGLAAAGTASEGESENNGAPSGGANRASDGNGAYFFGTYASGQRFVFIIDSSRSMLEGRRWATARRELVRALQSLSPDQEFFVIGFDSTAKPMFGQFPPNSKFLHPTESNIDRLNRWVGTILHGGSTLPASSIGIALRMKPDAIFLLSDGEIQDTTIQDLRVYNRRMNSKGDPEAIVPIHTVLLHSMAGLMTLQTIADENDGVFTPVTKF